jgi:drug/metabolite transporter (DMT)-like permease
MPTPNSGSSVRGVLLGLGAFSIFPVHDAPAKWLVRDFSVWQIMFVRSTVILLSLSVAGAAAQLLLFEALRRATASTIAPLEFTSLAWAFVLGHVVWGDMPDIFVLSGAMLIGVSGFIIVSTQWRGTGGLKKADART